MVRNGVRLRFDWRTGSACPSPNWSSRAKSARLGVVVDDALGMRLKPLFRRRASAQ